MDVTDNYQSTYKRGCVLALFLRNRITIVFPPQTPRLKYFFKTKIADCWKSGVTNWHYSGIITIFEASKEGSPAGSTSFCYVHTSRIYRKKEGVHLDFFLFLCLTNETSFIYFISFIDKIRLFQMELKMYSSFDSVGW